MQIATIVIPNLNGMNYLAACLSSLRTKSRRDFSVLLIDNGSTDGSVEFVRQGYPEVKLHCFKKNEGFCRAVNEGIRLAKTPYVILLNNDTTCEPSFVEELVRAMEQHPKAFSCAAKLVQLYAPEKMDNAGDYYCALGWAHAVGKGRPEKNYDTPKEIFSACAAGAIYRREVFAEIGLFDETHFAYLEDVDVAYRARIFGYSNHYAPKAVVHHVGSATSGSVYNDFKIRHSSRNNIYLIYKNMPALQILLNLPFLLAGFLVKFLFFAKKGFAKEYIGGLRKGFGLCRREKKVKYQAKHLKNYIRIQLELWRNLPRMLR